MSAAPKVVQSLFGWKRHAIRRLWSGVDVSAAREQLFAHPELWNQHTVRTAQYAHSNISDIWVRYNPFHNYDPNNGGLEAFNREHEAHWYPAVDACPAIKDVCLDVMRMVEGVRLGGVLITKIPPGGEVKPHIDRGWHAEYYDKFAVQLQGDERQSFNFEGESLVSTTGDLYTFDNSRLHWVTNASDIDRITLIVCVRLDHPGSFLWSKE